MIRAPRFFRDLADFEDAHARSVGIAGMLAVYIAAVKKVSNRFFTLIGIENDKYMYFGRIAGDLCTGENG